MNDLAKSTHTQTTPTSSPLADISPMGWLRGEIDRLFDDFGRPAARIFKFAPQFTSPVPAIEMIEADQEYRLSVELPGMTDKDVEIAVADGVLTISGEKKEECERKDDGYLVSERSYGSFKRQIALPADVQPDAIKAHFANGLLNVTIGKDTTVKARLHKIPIES